MRNLAPLEFLIPLNLPQSQKKAGLVLHDEISVTDLDLSAREINHFIRVNYVYDNYHSMGRAKLAWRV